MALFKDIFLLEPTKDTHGYIELFSSAKLNLSLLIYGKRLDGFHELHSVMATTGFSDRLVFSLNSEPEIKLEVIGGGSAVPTGPDNLICRAAQLLADYANVPACASIKVEKNIPAGGGLGGASSNAATTLLGLNQLWNLNLSNDELAPLAARLGSDVSFFLYAPLAECTGRGEIVKALAGRISKKLMLIIPGIHVSTADVYSNYRFDASAVNARRLVVDNLVKDQDFDGLFEKGFNSLTAVTMNIVPELSLLRENIEYIIGRPVFMSGSGSTLYVCGDSYDELNALADMLSEGDLRGTCSVVITDFVD